jgi:hypothetical protein
MWIYTPSWRSASLFSFYSDFYKIILGGCKEERKEGKRMEILGNEKRNAINMKIVNLGRETSDELEARTSEGTARTINLE